MAEETPISRRLSPEDQKNLSKALFPDIDTVSVSILGKERLLRPLPLKYSKIINSIVSPIVEDMEKDNKSDGPKKSYDLTLVNALKQVMKILSKFYGWGIEADLEDEENLTIAELQAVASLQVRLNGTNDFLLVPLRSIVTTMQLYEMAATQTNRVLKNTFTMQPS
jgi:hypothetical protein